MMVLIVCDRPVVAATMAATLREALPHVSTRIVPGLAECSRVLATHRPALAIVDLALTSAEARQVCRHLHQEGTRSIHLVDDSLDALALLEADADGVTTPQDGLEGLATAVDVVLCGNTHVPPVLLGGVLRGLLEQRRQPVVEMSDLSRLSAREREVLALLGSGLDQTEIARHLSISPQTAKTHIRHVMNKLGVRTRVAAAARAAELTQSGSGRTA
jgi:DNA-binding NarL/FixJ family response regulator